MTALPNVSHGASVALGLTAVCYGWGMRLDILCVEDVDDLAAIAMFSYRGEEYWFLLPPVAGYTAERTCRAVLKEPEAAASRIANLFLALPPEQRQRYLMGNIQKLLGEMA